jgi:aminopeptidase N
MKRVVALLAACLALTTSAALAQDRIVLPKDVTPSHYDIAIVPDAKAETFTGSAKIDIDVHEATSTIELNAADLDFQHVTLSGVQGEPKVTFDAAQETATLTFPAPIAPGHYVLAIDYTGKINDNAAGLFYLDYDAVGAAGGTKRALFTQFENSDARRFVPSWDEPAQKASFTLTATVPADQMAVSNMPIAASEDLPGGLKRVHFAQSPKMSSYLLFFGLGDFERISKTVDGVDVGVIVKRGDTEQGQYALDAAAHILPYYENYFGMKYPLPKLDLIAGPGQSQFFGAMENWGAIFYFERDLLIDPKIATEADKRNVYIVVAHEMAHQWFGDLVTMDWWDGIWLNEGFASWMENKSTGHFHPEWNLWSEVLGDKEAAMHMDSRAGTHPIIQPIKDVLQANEAFDTITYEKGESVIRMIENYVGEDAYRDGVRAYIAKYQYGNTVTDDLWAELDKTSPTPITETAHDFTLKAGIPLIRVSATPKGIRLTQDRFATDDTGKEETVWKVPVIEKTLGTTAEWRGFVSRGAPADIALAKGAVPVVNAGQGGYFRTLYDAKLSGELAAKFQALSPPDELGLLNDNRALGEAGYEPMSIALILEGKARPGMSAEVLEAIADGIDATDDLYRGLKGRQAFRRWGLSVLRPIFAKVGWEPKPGEGPNVALLRGELLGTLSDLDDPGVIAGAKTRFVAFLKDPNSLSPELRHNVLDIVAEHADAAIWDEIHTLAKNAKGSLEKRQYYILLGIARDPKLAARALDLSMTDETPVTLRPSLIAAVSGNRPDVGYAGSFPEMAFDFAVAHADAINAMLEPDSRNEFIPRLAGGSYDLATIPKLDAYAAAHIAPTAMRDVTVAEATIRYAAKLRAKRLPDIDKWLKAHKH